MAAAVPDQPLTAAERRVLELLATHLSPAEIGEALHISRNTVKGHLKAIYRKLCRGERPLGRRRARPPARGLLDPSG